MSIRRRSSGDWGRNDDSLVLDLREVPRSPSPPQPPRIILVDDDRDTREMLGVALEGHGFQVDTAPSGLRLWSLLTVDPPDLILLDVMMSWIDGYDLCKAIKSNPAFRDIPICFISARSDPASIDKGRACGAADYFVKPVDVGRLLARLDELIAQTAPRPS